MGTAIVHPDDMESDNLFHSCLTLNVLIRSGKTKQGFILPCPRTTDPTMTARTWAHDDMMQ